MKLRDMTELAVRNLREAIFRNTLTTLGVAVGVMAWADWRLTLAAIIPAPVVSLVVVLFGRMIHTRFEKIQKMFSDISSRVQENLSGVRVVRAYAQEHAEIAHFEALNQDYIAENVRLARITALFMPLIQVIQNLTSGGGSEDKATKASGGGPE